MIVIETRCYWLDLSASSESSGAIRASFAPLLRLNANHEGLRVKQVIAQAWYVTDFEYP